MLRNYLQLYPQSDVDIHEHGIRRIDEYDAILHATDDQLHRWALAFALAHVATAIVHDLIGPLGFDADHLEALMGEHVTRHGDRVALLDNELLLGPVPLCKHRSSADQQQDCKRQ